MEVSEDILHPRLYSALRNWRNEEAKRQGLPAYAILHQKAILGIANTLPTGSRRCWQCLVSGKKYWSAMEPGYWKL